MTKPSTDLQSRIERLVGARPRRWTRASGGYTPAERWVVELDDGRSIFAKAAVDEDTAEWLRIEHRAYRSLRGPFMAQLLAWEDGDRPILILEDLSHLPWPPPWDDERVRSVLDMLDAIAATRPPDWLPPLEKHWIDLRGWSLVADDPQPFLSLGLADETWLDAALPVLLEASDACRLTGDQLLHLDVRSDNICFRHSTAMLVDWNMACVGNARLDLAFWLPSLALEGGPPPDELLPDAPAEAALVSGLFAARAGLPNIPTAPRVRAGQLRQLRQALPWASRALGIPQP